MGLEIQLDRMVALGCTDTLVDYEGGFLHLSYSTIWVPVRWLDPGALQRHLITEAKGKRIVLWEVEKEVKERVLITNTRMLKEAYLFALVEYSTGVTGI